MNAVLEHMDTDFGALNDSASSVSQYKTSVFAMLSPIALISLHLSSVLSFESLRIVRFSTQSNNSSDIELRATAVAATQFLLQTMPILVDICSRLLKSYEQCVDRIVLQSIEQNNSDKLFYDNKSVKVNNTEKSFQDAKEYVDKVIDNTAVSLLIETCTLISHLITFPTVNPSSDGEVSKSGNLSY
jgi:hypothetical protein